MWVYNPQRKKGISPKLQSKWKGPYLIVRKIGDLVFQVKRTARCKPWNIHYDRLKIYRGEALTSWLRDPPEIEEEEVVMTDLLTADSDTEWLPDTPSPVVPTPDTPIPVVPTPETPDPDTIDEQTDGQTDIQVSAPSRTRTPQSPTISQPTEIVKQTRRGRNVKPPSRLIAT